MFKKQTGHKYFFMMGVVFYPLPSHSFYRSFVNFDSAKILLLVQIFKFLLSTEHKKRYTNHNSGDFRSFLQSSVMQYTLQGSYYV